LPGTDRPVVRYRVLLHDLLSPPATPTAQGDRPAESAADTPTDRPKHGIVADMPITARMSLLVLAVLVVYVTVMVAAFGIAAGALVVVIGVVVLVAARGRGLH
jgi:hypothetical protein